MSVENSSDQTRRLHLSRVWANEDIQLKRGYHCFVAVMPYSINPPLN